MCAGACTTQLQSEFDRAAMNKAGGAFFHQLYALLCTQAQQDTQRDTSDDDSMMRKEWKSSAATTCTASGDDDGQVSVVITSEHQEQ